MIAISKKLFKIILELQQLPSLSRSALGGGTNLAIRYNHRLSYDIDLFFPDIIGKRGFESIKKEVEKLYPDNTFGFDYPCDIDDQFLFQRFYVRYDDTAVKVEILQNMQTHDAPDIINGIKLISTQDIGLLKLMSACERANQKDIYDLDYITDYIPLNDLLAQLRYKQNTYNLPIHQTIFDLDKQQSPIEHPELLLKFDKQDNKIHSRPGHSNPRVDFIEGQKNWLAARSSWRRKVRAYYKSINKAYPTAAPEE